MTVFSVQLVLENCRTQFLRWLQKISGGNRIRDGTPLEAADYAYISIRCNYIDAISMQLRLAMYIFPKSNNTMQLKICSDRFRYFSDKRKLAITKRKRNKGFFKSRFVKISKIFGSKRRSRSHNLSLFVCSSIRLSV